jgi:lycopene cyclase domain-containing protein
MKEYTLLAVISVLATLLLDMKSGIRLLIRGEYYVFFLLILIFKGMVNGYLTFQNIVIYNSQFFMGIRVGSIPLEDFLFGFSMVTMTIIFWERFKKDGVVKSQKTVIANEVKQSLPL